MGCWPTGILLEVDALNLLRTKNFRTNNALKLLLTKKFQNKKLSTFAVDSLTGLNCLLADLTQTYGCSSIQELTTHFVSMVVRSENVTHSIFYFNRVKIFRIAEMTFAELTKRIKLSPSRKTEYFLKYRSLIDKEKLFIEEVVRISYNLGKLDVTQEHIENYKRLFPEPSELDKNNLTGLKSKTVKDNLTGLNSKRGKSNGTNKSKRP